VNIKFLSGTISCFNPRPRAGGDSPPGTRCHRRDCFNPRPRAGGDSLQIYESMRSSMFQSTPPRRGRLEGLHGPVVGELVSIHAPAQGATRRRAHGHDRHHVSIHAPAQGATPLTLQAFSGDLVSIHAPAQGATVALYISDKEALVSIHAPAQGATLSPMVHFKGLLFQSTPPRRGRLWGRSQRYGQTGGFNPRPRAGGDWKRRKIRLKGQVSIHAPAQGATVFFYLLLFNEFSLSSARTICLFVLTDILFSKNILISPVISSCFILREHPWFSMSSTGSRAVR